MLSEFLFIDEVGYGSWAGPVVCCSIQSSVLTPVDGIGCDYLYDICSRVGMSNISANRANRTYDSKKISKIQRMRLFIENNVLYRWRLGWASAAEVTNFGIRTATNMAIERSLFGNPSMVFLDGIILPKVDGFNFISIKNGDAIIKEIGIASIIAKIMRDNYMYEASKLYPEYGFDKNVGYGSPYHIEALKKNPVTLEHRLNYKPIKRLLDGNSLKYCKL